MPIRGIDEMEKEAARFVRGLTTRVGRATVVALSGDLGSGKTAFVKAVAKALGVREHVTSPTFVIMKLYDLYGQKFKRLVHVDAYRLKGERHLKVLGWGELLCDPQNLIFVEWPDHAGSAIPQDVIHIALRYSGEHEREIVYKKGNAVEKPEALGAT